MTARKLKKSTKKLFMQETYYGDASPGKGCTLLRVKLAPWFGCPEELWPARARFKTLVIHGVELPAGPAVIATTRAVAWSLKALVPMPGVPERAMRLTYSPSPCTVAGHDHAANPLGCRNNVPSWRGDLRCDLPVSVKKRS